MNATWNCRLTTRARVVLLVSALAILPLSLQGVLAANEQPTVSKEKTVATETGRTSLPPLQDTTTGGTAPDMAKDGRIRSGTFVKEVRIGAAAPSTSRAESKISSDEIDALREHVTFLEEQFKKQDALYRTGSRGGSADKRSITGYELAVAQADLALAEDRRDKAIEFCEQAEKFADEALKNVTATYEAGRTPLEVLLQTARSVSESKRRLARIRRASNTTAPTPDRRNEVWR